MQEVPDDLFQQDMQSFPTEDPRITAELKKQHAEALRQQKAKDAADARDKKQSKAKEHAAVEKAVAMPVQKPTTVSPAAATRAREVKMMKIRLYYEKLGDRLSSKLPKTLPKTDEGIDELLATIECELHSNGGIEQASNVYIASLVGFEQFTQAYNPLGLMLQGPAASLSTTVAGNKAKWNDLITEFAIANAEWFMMGPGKRLIAFTFQMVHTVHLANVSALGAARVADDKMKEDASDL
jgi:hypothetical protein